MPAILAFDIVTSCVDERTGVRGRSEMTGWRTIEVPNIRTLPRPVFLRSQKLPARHKFPMHAHLWNQFVYATSGTLTVTVEQARYVITPEQAIWIPTGVYHTPAALDDVEFRSLYIENLPDIGMPTACSVLAVSPLLRALILELAATIQTTSQTDYHSHLDAVILVQISRLPKLEFFLPWPRSSQLREVCEILYSSPDDQRSIQDWALRLRMSSRTLARHFKGETGLSLRLWRHRLRVFRAMEWLGAKGRVTDIALELGFGSASAFTYAFRKEMGCSPTEWRNR